MKLYGYILAMVFIPVSIFDVISLLIPVTPISFLNKTVSIGYFFIFPSDLVPISSHNLAFMQLYSCHEDN